MITIGIDPVALSLGPLSIRWYGIMVVLATITIVLFMLKEARRTGFAEEHIYNVATWAIIGGVLGSRIVHVIDKWDYYSKNPTHIIGFEGVAVYGAVIGIMVAVLVYCGIKKLSFWQLGDIIAPGALVGMAIGRVGCLINGCCYGDPTDLPWALAYSHPNSYAPLMVGTHPAPAYHIIWNMAAFALVWSLRRHLKPQGSLFLLYLALYATGDFFIRFFREGDAFFFGIPQAQVIGILILLVTVPWLIIRTLSARKTTALESNPEQLITTASEDVPANTSPLNKGS